MSKYIFISNSTKPTREEYESLADIKLVNVNRPCLTAAKELGYDVILGVNRKYPEKLKCSEMDISFYNSHTFRNIFAFKDNYIAYKNLCNVLKQGDVEVIHCNTPIGGFIGRICGKKYKVPKVIYTAHGFHFYKGASLFCNTIIKWTEFYLARYTDVIITMNEEDCQNAKKMKLRNKGKVYKINGVGINLKEYQAFSVDKEMVRKELDLQMDDFVCIAMGDLIKRKNYKMAIEAIAECNNPKIKYLICGTGPEFDNLKQLCIDLDVENQIHFLGFRKDIKELLAISDCFLFTSLQEGLPRSLMEAMASGLPCVVTKIRGNTDLIQNDVNGYLIYDEKDCSKKLISLMNNEKKRKSFSKSNNIIIKEYDVSKISEKIFDIYSRHI